MYEFTEVDKAATDNLPERLTTANRAQVLTLYAKIRSSFDFDGKNKYYARLEKAKNEIDALLQEIDDIKRLIKAELYPFDQVSLADKKTVDELYARYIALSEYDRSLFEQSDVEGLVKAKTQVDNLQTCACHFHLRRRCRCGGGCDDCGKYTQKKETKTCKANAGKRGIMKKDLIVAVIAIFLIVVIACGTKIQSVDDYYLTHIDDITPDSQTVTVSIRCDTVFDNWDKLDDNLKYEKYVPQSGAILDDYKMVLRKGDTVYDVLNRAVRHHKIHMECVYSANYGSVYVQGINNLYEFSCGELSGWMYRVNGVFPNYGCSKYVLKDGDVVEWVYTCDHRARCGRLHGRCGMKFFDKLHPAAAFIYFVVVVMLTMFTSNPLVVGASFVFGVAFCCFYFSARDMCGSLLLALPMMIVIALVNPLFVHKGDTILFFLNDNPVTKEAILYGVNMSVTITAVVLLVQGV